ncbi:hypothetical protein ACTHGU_17375 [Chitinophagaceae bacterium MMS25-I14]
MPTQGGISPDAGVDDYRKGITNARYPYHRMPFGTSGGAKCG